MTEDEHAALAELMLATSVPLARDSRTAIMAGELVWGAVVHALHAVGHAASIRPQHPTKNNGMINILRTIDAQADVQDALEGGLRRAQRRLHNNFYTARLSEAQLADEIAGGVAFVGLLLEIAGRHRTE